MKNKFRIFFSVEKEEQWLNRQLAKGWQLEAVSGNVIYQFRAQRPDNKIIQLDYRKFTNESNYVDYLQLMTDAGWQVVAGSAGSATHYFIGDATQNRHLFSDRDSLLERAKRTRDGSVLGVLLAVVLAVLLLSDSFDASYLFDITKAFNTKALVGQSGFGLVSEFLFQMVGAVVRLTVHLGVVIVMVLAVIGIIGAHLSFVRYQKNHGQSLE